MVIVTFVALLLAFHPLPGPTRPQKYVPKVTRHVRIEMQQQVSGAAAQKAASLLGNLALGGLRNLNSSEPIVTKEFNVDVKLTRSSIIQEGAFPLAEYMQLPVDQYSLYDPRLMERLEEKDVQGGDIFQLTLPTLRPREGEFMPRPKLRVRVRPGADELWFESLSGILFDGGPQAALPPNVTAADLKAAEDYLESQLSFGFDTSLVWGAARKGSTENSKLTCTTSVRLRLQLPPPFTSVPKVLVQGAIGLIIRFVGQRVLSQFMRLLEVDYQRYCNGTRDLNTGLGSLLLDDDGYVVLPRQMKAQTEAKGLKTVAPAIAGAEPAIIRKEGFGQGIDSQSAKKGKRKKRKR